MSDNRLGTHWNECWKSGRDHYGCALARLEAEVKRREAAEALCESIYHVPLNTGPTQQELADAWQQLVKEAT